MEKKQTAIYQKILVWILGERTFDGFFRKFWITKILMQGTKQSHLQSKGVLQGEKLR